MSRESFLILPDHARSSGFLRKSAVPSFPFSGLAAAADAEWFRVGPNAMARFFLTLLLLVMVAAAPARLGAQTRITPIGELRALNPEAARTFGGVTMEAVTTYYDPAIRTFFVQDGTGGIFVNIAADRAPLPAPQPGDRFRLHGTVSPGDFLPMLDLSRLEPLGSGPPPAPRLIAGQELQNPELDCAWVEVEAMVQATSLGQYGSLVLDLRVDGIPVTAHLPTEAKFTSQPWHLQQRRVRVRGVVATWFNDERQMCGRRLFLPRLENVIPEQPVSQDFDVPLRLTTELLRAGSTAGEKVRVRGIVTMTDPGTGLTLRDEAGSLLVNTAQQLELKPGDQVEIHGYPSMAHFRPRLQAVEVQRVEKGATVDPLPFDCRPPYPSRWHQELVTLEVNLIDLIPSREITTLLCSADSGERFEARLAGTLPTDLGPASRVRLTGICGLIPPGPRSRSVRPSSGRCCCAVPPTLCWSKRRRG